MVAWMSGLVTGLQNRAQRFESASDLKMKVCQFNLTHLCFLLLSLIKMRVPLSSLSNG